MLCRPYCVGSTGSPQTSEIKWRRARLVLGWETTPKDLRVPQQSPHMSEPPDIASNAIRKQVAHLESGGIMPSIAVKLTMLNILRFIMLDALRFLPDS